jgi:hypothetical protein
MPMTSEGMRANNMLKHHLYKKKCVPRRSSNLGLYSSTEASDFCLDLKFFYLFKLVKFSDYYIETRFIAPALFNLLNATIKGSSLIQSVLSPLLTSNKIRGYYLIIVMMSLAPIFTGVQQSNLFALF